MTVAVAGGTGTLGSAVVAALQARGHDVRVLSRHSPDHPIDLRTGAGLDVALAGMDAVVDASNAVGRAARAVLVEGSRRLLEAEQALGISHHVAVSIIGCERVSWSYYDAKAAQEDVIRASSVPWTLVRATQFHDLLDTIFGATAKIGLRPSAAVPVQPVAVDEVAVVIADAVERGAPVGDGGSTPAPGRTLEVVGPETLDLADLSHAWSKATGRRCLPLRLPLVGAFGRALREGGLTSADADVVGSETFARWLETARRHPRRRGR